MVWKEISLPRVREREREREGGNETGSCEQILGRGCPDFALGMAGFSPLLQTAENDSKVF